MSDELLAAFASEGAEILEGLESSIAELEEGKGGAVDTVFRAVHTLKGSAAIVGLPLLEAFAHGLEGRLARLRSGEASISDEGFGLLNACRDRMASIFDLGSGAPTALSEAELSLLAELDAALRPAGSSRDQAERPPEEPAEPASARPASPAAEGPGAAYLRVADAKLDAILEEASELSQSISELGRRLKGSSDQSLAEQALSIYGLAARHYRSVLSLRTVPFGEVVERYRRAAADIARASGKEIDCEVVGGDTEIDKALADRLAEPLLHLTRNAADHGIEAPEARLAAGKGGRGRIVFEARRDASFLLVRVSDDGRGVDPRAVRERAEESGLLRRAAGGSVAGASASLDDEALLSLLLLPGFSLSKDVTKWSGRGVGLDAVDRSIKAARGSLRLRSALGSGFEAEIRLPLALSLVEGFTASAGGTELLVPFESVVSCGAVESVGASASGGSASTAVVDGQLLPALDLGLLFGEGGVARSIAVVVESGGHRAALLVEGVGEALSAAVRPLDRRFADSPGLSGISALGDGSLVLVLDAAELLRLAGC